MRVKDFKARLALLDDDMEVMIRSNDNAYPPKLRFFRSNEQITVFVEVDETKLGHHQNYPEGYRGVEEVFLK